MYEVGPGGRGQDNRLRVVAPGHGAQERRGGGRNPGARGKVRDGQCLAGVWLPGNMGKGPVGLEAAARWRINVKT